MSKVLTRVDGRVLTVTINRPESMNALDPETHALMSAAFDRYAADDELWLAVVRGAGGEAFSAGGDIRAMQDALDGKAEYKVPASGYGGLTSRHGLDKPLLAVVEGVAMGGGFEIALACDIIIARDNARFALPEPMIGAVAFAGGMHRLPRQVGMKRAMQMLLTGQSLDAGSAPESALVNEVVDAAALEDTVARWCRRLTAGAPLALRATKACVEAGHALPLADAIALQDTGGYPALERMRESEDVLEGIRAFNEKRKPVWRGR